MSIFPAQGQCYMRFRVEPRPDRATRNQLKVVHFIERAGSATCRGTRNWHDVLEPMSISTTQGGAMCDFGLARRQIRRKSDPRIVRGATARRVALGEKTMKKQIKLELDTV